MNWEAVGAISEAVGVIAILISLAYLAVQIRQSTQEFSRGIEASQMAAFESNIESGNRIRELLILNPDLIELMSKGYASYTNLDTAAKLRFSLLLRNFFSSMQGAYIRHLSIDNDTRGFEGSARVLDEMLQNPGVREWLMGKRPDWRPEFLELVEQRLAVFQQNDKGE